MERSVKVIDCKGNVLGDTYTKRARQLVKNERAVWVSDETIRLAVEHYKEEKMDNIKEINNKAPTQSTSNKVADTGGESLSTSNQAPTQSTSSEAESIKLALEKMTLKAQLLEDEMILQKVKWRLKKKNSLIWQTVSLIIMVSFAIAAYVINDYNMQFYFNGIGKEVLESTGYSLTYYGIPGMDLFSMLLIVFSAVWLVVLFFQWRKFLYITPNSLRLKNISNSIKKSINDIKVSANNRRDVKIKAECEKIKNHNVVHAEDTSPEASNVAP